MKDGRGPLDFAMVFAKTQAELKQKFVRLAKRLAPLGMLWISWPKNTFGSCDRHERERRVPDRAPRCWSFEGVRGVGSVVRPEVCAQGEGSLGLIHGLFTSHSCFEPPPRPLFNDKLPHAQAGSMSLRGSPSTTIRSAYFPGSHGTDVVTPAEQASGVCRRERIASSGDIP